jgi:hypothetical protein
MSAARARSQRVLRCECGQFVRLDRTLAETRSDPAPAPAPDSELADAFDDEETHMFSSLEDLAAFRSPSGSATTGTSVYDEDDAATRVASSPVNLPPPPTAPPARASSPSSPPARPSSPVQRAPSASNDKPLWYVDLGGTETVEMTIEQLIIARRSGKLGEGALVWRAGMPRWRPIGSLIPAAGSGAPRQTVSPAAPERAKETPMPALGSYERPLATLEFALEKPSAAAPRERPLRSAASAAQPTPPSQPPPRAPTPIPRAPAHKAHSQVGPLPPLAPPPAPAHLAPPAAPAPDAPHAPGASARPMASVSLLMQRSSPLPPPRSPVSSPYAYPWRGQRPRWLSVGIAVLVCVAASAAGAVFVRALKIRRQPLSLSPTPVSVAPAVAPPKQPTNTPPPTAPEVTSSTSVVDIDSLSVEHRAPRVAPRALVPAQPALPPGAPDIDKNTDTSPTDDTSPAPAAAQPAPHKAKSQELPSAAHSNPYTTGSSSDNAAKKPAPSNSDDPGF